MAGNLTARYLVIGAGERGKRLVLPKRGADFSVKSAAL
jgi:hypothetical protein